MDEPTTDAERYGMARQSGMSDKGAKRYVEQKYSGDEPRGTDKTGGGETLNGQILRAMCAIDGLPPILAAVLAEVVLIQSGCKGKMLSDMTEIERRTFDIANSITQLLRLSKEGAHG